MKRKHGDRRDGRLIRKIGPLHFVMPLLYPNRCDNEAFISQRIDLTNTDRYIAEKNAKEPEYEYNLFQIIVTAMLKTITLRPKMNRFIANGNYYQRNEVSAAFVVKKVFADDGGEGLAYIHAKERDNIDTIHNEIYRQISGSRSGEKNSTDSSLDTFQKVPRVLAKIFAYFVRILDKHGKVPYSFIAADPYYSSVILTNLGSLGLQAGYHHLTNWGTNSVFCAIGEKKKRPFYDEEGNMEMRDSIELGLTIDERLADGYYYSKTVHLLKLLIENPELLEKALDEEVKGDIYGK